MPMPNGSYIGSAELIARNRDIKMAWYESIAPKYCWAPSRRKLGRCQFAILRFK